MNFKSLVHALCVLQARAGAPANIFFVFAFLKSAKKNLEYMLEPKIEQFLKVNGEYFKIGGVQNR